MSTWSAFTCPLLSEIDTRALVRHLRAQGVMRGVISTVEQDADVLVAKARALRKMDGTDLASVVSTKEAYEWKQRAEDPLKPGAAEQQRDCNLHVVAYDYGIKQNILHMLGAQGCRVTVVPARTTAEDVLSLAPDGVFSFKRSGRPGAADLCDRGDPRPHGQDAGVRHLPGGTSWWGRHSGARRSSSSSDTMAATIR